MRFRQSTLKIWQQCALQAKFASLDDGPRIQNARATFGTCVHYAIDEYHQSLDVEKAVETFKRVWAHPEKIHAAPDFWPKYMTFGQWREKGIELVRGYHEKTRWEPREILASEHQFLVPIGEHELTGTVDLIELRKNKSGKRLIRIVDMKTNAKAPSMSELQMDIQFTTYMYASLQKEFWVGNGPNFPGMPNGEMLYANLANLPRRGIWWHLQTAKEHDAGGRDDEDYMRLYRLITEIEKAVERDVFVPTISGDACLYCPYNEPCGVKILTKEQLEEEEDAW